MRSMRSMPLLFTCIFIDYALSRQQYHIYLNLKGNFQALTTECIRIQKTTKLSHAEIDVSVAEGKAILAINICALNITSVVELVNKRLQKTHMSL